MKVIGVTGGTGFIGQYVAEELIKKGYEVILVDYSARSVASEFEIFLADIRDRTAMIEFAAHVDGVIHLAAVLGTQETIQNPTPAAETNILGGLNILDGCKQYGLPLVYAGVGNYWMRNTYSTTKTAVENLLLQYRDEFNCPFGVVRPVNAYGPRQRAAAPFAPGKVRKIVPAFVCRAISGMDIEVYGTGSQVSDMVHVKDVARAFVVTLENCSNAKVPQNPIEIGPIQSKTVRDVAELVSSLTASQLNSEPVGIKNLPMRPGEKDTSEVSIEKIEEIIALAKPLLDEDEQSHLRRALRTLGSVVCADITTLKQIGIDAESFMSLEQGINETINWFIENENITWSKP